MAQLSITRPRRDGIGGNKSPSMWLVLFGLVLLLGGCAYGDYRMPFEDGTQVFVFRDHVTHFSPTITSSTTKRRGSDRR